MKGAISFFYSITQLHAGKGSDVGVVDLPIQREIHTGYPIVSGIKGAMRNEFSWGDDEDRSIFGAPQDKNEDKAGSIAITEAKVFLFPIRSLDRGFVWITSPLVLSRISTALKIIKKEELSNKIDDLLKDLKNKKEEKELSTFESGTVYIEEYTADTEQSDKLKSIIEELKDIAPTDYLNNKILDNVMLISDENFSFFVKNATEVNARIRINSDTNTVDNNSGGLWYEEYLPQDTVMYSIIKELSNKNTFDQLKEKIEGSYFNLGGKATIGKGIVYTKLIEGEI
jgi:CRISPR-associated protein Cmr4